MERTDWDNRYRTKELVWTAEPNRFVVAETESLPPGRVLDLAAGEGRNAVWFAERGWQATAVDFSEVAMAKAADLAAHRGVRIETVVADVTTYEPSPGTYDLVVVAYLQVPAPDRVAALAHAADALADRGTMVVVGHDRSNLRGGWGGPKDPAVQGTPEELAASLRELGLRIVKAELVEREVDTPEGRRVAIDHVVVARADRPVRTGPTAPWSG
jgi:SAM-dependent methyltransferase